MLVHVWGVCLSFVCVVCCKTLFGDVALFIKLDQMTFVLKTYRLGNHIMIMITRTSKYITRKESEMGIRG
jgi:hypothetical protein